MLSSLKLDLYFVTWLRYTMWIVLYPLGAGCECKSSFTGVASVCIEKSSIVEKVSRYSEHIDQSSLYQARSNLKYDWPTITAQYNLVLLEIVWRYYVYGILRSSQGVIFV